MRFVIFLVSLCCLLLKGDSSVYASAIHKDINYAATKEAPQHHKHSRKKQSANSNKTNQNYSAIEDSAIESESLISYDQEDDDILRSLIAKHKLPVRGSSLNLGVTSSSYQSFLSYRGKYFNASPCLFGQISYKYLVLGVFKI